MSTFDSNDLLHKTVKNLHVLHTYNGNVSAYYGLLKQTVLDVIRLLNYEKKQYSKLTVSSESPQHSLDFIMYHSFHENTVSSLVQYLNNTNTQAHANKHHGEQQESGSFAAGGNAVLKNLVSTLSHINGKRPTRIKDSYSQVLVKLSQLIQYFITLHSESEQALLGFLVECAEHEMRFYSQLQHQLSNLSDTQRAVDFLDSLMREHEISDTSDTNSIFSYDEDLPQLDALGTNQVRFKTNNDGLDQLYSVFIKLLSFKPPHERDPWAYMKLMVSLWKKNSGIAFIEVDSFETKEQKLNQFMDFWEASESGFVLLPNYPEINQRVFSETSVFPEMINDIQPVNETIQPSKNHEKEPEIELDINSISDSRANSYGVSGVDSIENFGNSSEEVFSNHPYSKEDQAKLYSNIKHIVPLLNEFDLNFSVQFPSVFKYYLRLMYGDLPTISTTKDLRFVDEIVFLVNKIVDFENEEDEDDSQIKTLVAKFHSAHLLLSKFSEKQSLLMRMSQYEYSNNLEIKRVSFKQWRRRIEKITDLQKSYENYTKLFNKKLIANYLHSWYRQKSTYGLLEAEASRFSSRILLDRTMSKWVASISKHMSLEQVALTSFLHKFLSVWVHKVTKIQRSVEKAISIDSKRIERKYFVNLVKKYNCQVEYSQICQDFRARIEEERDAQAVKKGWEIWRSRLNSRHPIPIGDKLLKLASIEKQWILRKTFETWKHKHMLEMKLNTARAKTDQVLVSYVFKDHWHKKARLQSVLNTYLELKYRQIKKSFYHLWVQQIARNKVCEDFYRKNTMKKVFKTWVLQKKRLESHQESNSSLRVYFKKWALKYYEQQYEKDCSSRIQSGMLLRWRQKLQRIDNMVAQKDLFESDVIVRNKLKAWKLATRHIEEYANIADINLQRKFYNTLMKKHHHINVLLNQRLDYVVKNTNFERKYLLQLSFRKWKATYDDHFEASSYGKIDSFRETMLDPSLKTRFLHRWIDTYNLRQARKDHLDHLCSNYLKTCKTKTFYFGKWSALARSKTELTQKAIDFQVSVLLKKFLLIWYDQFVTKGLYLHEVADDYVDSRHIRQVQNMLSIWSMKYFKHRRNQQSCSVFAERWQNVKMKSIFELWLFKLEEKRKQQQQVEAQEAQEIDQSDSSFDTSLASNMSPLANKSASRSLIRHDDNYLSTPLKAQVSRNTFFTPKSAKSSPTKLQETSQRIKNEKLDALRKHYGRLKGTSTPRKPSGTLSNPAPAPRMASPSKKLELDARFETLLPKPTPIDYSKPRKSIRYRANEVSVEGSIEPRAYSVLPPKPPNFEPLLDDVDREMNYRLSSSSSKEDEKSVIDNAKKLRRITPIMFPIDDEGSQPKFSPVKKLKERLRNSTVAQDEYSF